MKQPVNVINSDPDYMMGWKSGQPVLVPKIGDGEIATFATDPLTGAVTGLVGPGGVVASVAATPEAYGYHPSKTVTENTAAINALVADKKILLLGTDYEYVVNAPISSPDSGTALVVRGAGTKSGSSLSKIRGTHGDFVFKPAGSYDIEGVMILGDSSTTSGIGSIGVDGSSGRARIDNVYLSGLKHGVLFDSSWEHPLGVDIDRVYCQDFSISGIVIGGSGSASSGESAMSIGSLIVTNSSRTPTSYTSNVAQNTPNATSDTVSWTGISEPYFGFLLLRSADGATNWEVVPNLSKPIQGDTSFIATKTSGETWQYRLVTCTVGAQFNRLKACGANVIQTEYVGVGLWLNNITAFSAQSLYCEQRPATIQRATLCGVLAEGSSLHISQAWVEDASFAYVNRGSTLSYDFIRASGMLRAVIGAYDTGAAPVSSGGLIQSSGSAAPSLLPLTNGAREVCADLQVSSDGNMTRRVDSNTTGGFEVYRRGVLKAAIRTNSSSESEVLADRAVFTAPGKTHSSLLNSTQSTSLVNSVATAVFNLTIASNSASSVTLPFGIRVLDGGSVSRQVCAGILTVAACSASGTVVAGATVSGIAKALQSGTLGDPVFTTSVAGDIVTVSVNVTTSIGSPIMRFCLVHAASTISTPLLVQA